MTEDAERLAERMWATARVEEQCSRSVPDDELADEIRQRVRRLARSDDVKVRTARMDDLVVIVRLDARIWAEDADTMRRKLLPGRTSRSGSRPDQPV